MADLSGVRPGDTLILSGSWMRGRHENVTVTRVGRKYVYAKGCGRESKYHMGTGVAADNNGRTSLRTPEQVASDARRTALLLEIKEHGFRPVEFRADRITDRVLELVAAALHTATTE
jgi:hypothetical protein